MRLLEVYLLAALIFVAAVLYSSVGHGGGSGYLAAMAIVGLAPDVMKPTALFLNILVSTISSVSYYRAGAFSWRLFWPFAVASIPLAFVGGIVQVPTTVYRQVVGAVLLVAAFRMYRTAGQTVPFPTRGVPVVGASICGGSIGLLSGLTGVGGGIFLGPLLLFARWADAKQTAGVSAVFVLVSSAAGLAGRLSATSNFPSSIGLWAVAAVAGGLLGATIGSRRFDSSTPRRALAVVLVIARVRLIFA